MADPHDVRRDIPRTDTLLELPELQDALRRLGPARLKKLTIDAQQRARDGHIEPEQVVEELVAAATAARASSMRPVINATGVVVHTNLGRAPLSATAIESVIEAGGYVDIELDLATGARSGRGLSARDALLAACPDAEDALVVNNGAAALVLATTALAGTGELLVSRGELVEIGAGFRIPELVQSTGTRLREVGTTNRTHLRDYAEAVGDHTRGILKVHPSNYRVTGFTSQPSIRELRTLADDTKLPLIVDQGSGLLSPDPLLPDEPDVNAALGAGADVVIASGDKLLGGPQAGIIVGRSGAVRRIATHPLARAMRIDKLRLAALEATLAGPESPVMQAIHAQPQALESRARALASAIGADVLAHDGRVGGGGGAGVSLPGFAVRLPQELAEPLRLGDPAILTRVHDGAALLDLRCVRPQDDAVVRRAILITQGK